MEELLRISSIGDPSRRRRALVAGILPNDHEYWQGNLGPAI